MHCKGVEVRKFVRSDWDEIDPRAENAKDLEELRNIKRWEDVYTARPFFTYRHDGQIIMIYGMIWTGCGTYEPAIILSKSAKKHVKTIMKLLYAYYMEYTNAKEIRRLEAKCDAEDPEAIRLARHFGFDVIGIRHNATVEGHDQILMERLVYCDPRKIGVQQ